MTSRITRTLIADNHAMFREGLRALLNTDDNLEIVAEAEDGRDAIKQSLVHEPDLVLMDLTMPHTNGTDAIGPIKSRLPYTKIIVLTIHNSEEHIQATLRAGADGYVLKDDTHEDLLKAINSVVSGKTYLSPGICTGVISGYLNKTSSNDSSKSWTTLTKRERELIKLIAEGMTNKEIAAYLSISIKTVEKHRSNIMKKLDLHNASSLTAFAISNGLA